MLLKLIMPYIDRMVQGGTIVRWHKTEGDRVSYGDDLLDIEIEIKLWSPKPLSEKIKNVMEARRPDDGNVVSMQEMSRRSVFYMRITSSDAGFIRRIRAQKGQYRDVGSIIAVLTLDAHESFNESKDLVTQASTFRVVTNTIQLE